MHIYHLMVTAQTHLLHLNYQNTPSVQPDFKIILVVKNEITNHDHQLLKIDNLFTMSEVESIGALKVPRLILTATVLTLGSLAICWATASVKDPTIMQSAMQYPYTIIFRIGMMYSLFITFLELLFIKWWIDSFPIYRKTKLMVILGTIGLAGYGLFVACIDRKRINYTLASDAVVVASLGITACIYLIMRNLSFNRSAGYALANEESWLYKKIFSSSYGVAFIMGVLIYSGILDIEYKPLVEYTSVISASLFFWSFSIDFQSFKMDVEWPKQREVTPMQ